MAEHPDWDRQNVGAAQSCDIGAEPTINGILQMLVTYEEWVPEDVSAQPFLDPLNLQANEPVILHGPPTKRVKNVWTKRTTTCKQFVE